MVYGTVHMWGIGGKPSLVSPECIALYWFLNGVYARESSRKDLEICFTNNTDLSPTQELPVLITNDDCKISGFVNITAFLTKDSTMNDGNQLLQNALLQLTNTQLTTLTEYQLYLNKTNYEEFTRNMFTKLLYWPMWYNTPAHYRSLAREKCTGLLQDIGIDDSDSQLPSVEDQEPSELAQSKTFKITKQRKTLRKEELQKIKQDLVFLNKLTECLKIWIQIRERSLSEKVILADLLMWANIFVQLQLPDGARISQHLSQALGADFFNTLQKQLVLCYKFDPQVPKREPTFQEQGNPLMALYNNIYKLAP